MYYAGIRPEEAINLRTGDIVVRSQVRIEEGQDPLDEEDWGELHLRSATPDAGSEWTDDGSPRERDSSSTGPRATAGSCRSTLS